MIQFILRYFGVLVSSFCIGLGRPFNSFTIILTLIAVLSITVSNITYYEIGKKGVDL